MGRLIGLVDRRTDNWFFDDYAQTLKVLNMHIYNKICRGNSHCCSTGDIAQALVLSFFVIYMLVGLVSVVLSCHNHKRGEALCDIITRRAVESYIPGYLQLVLSHTW